MKKKKIKKILKEYYDFKDRYFENTEVLHCPKNEIINAFAEDHYKKKQDKHWASGDRIHEKEEHLEFPKIDVKKLNETMPLRKRISNAFMNLSQAVQNQYFVEVDVILHAENPEDSDPTIEKQFLIKLNGLDQSERKLYTVVYGNLIRNILTQEETDRMIYFIVSNIHRLKTV